MKLLSFLTLSLMLSISACSHHHKGGHKDCCAHKEKMSCTKEDCKKACCDNKEKMCKDGSCAKQAKQEQKACCSGDSCHKKS